MSKNDIEKNQYTVGEEASEGETTVIQHTALEEGAFAFDGQLERGLKQRHIQMIALAGAIGTGLFLSSGGALSRAGPVGLLLAYIVVGTVVLAVQLCITETSTLMPVTGSYIRHAEHFIDPAYGFAIGWNRVYASLVSGPAEVTAAAVCFQYWTSISPALWISILIVCLAASNVGPVKFFGEVEFFFSILKILLIVGLILLGVIIDLGGTDTPRLGFHYWRDPGPFAAYLVSGSVGKFVGFWNVLSSAVYAYGGVNEVSLSAAETQNPRTNIPRACKRIFLRVFFFYIVLLFVVTLVVPYDDPSLANSSGDANSSPLVIAAQRAQIKVLPHIINAVVISSAWSSANSGILGGSRSLYALAAKNQAPKIFLRTNRFKVPYVAIIVKLLFMSLGYMSVQSTADTVFSWFQNLTSSSIMVSWIIMCHNHIAMDRSLKAQGIPRSDLPWQTRFTPFVAWFGLIGSCLFLLTGGFTVFIHGHWQISTFFSSYFNIPLFAGLYIVGKLFLKSKLVKPSEVDLESLFADIRNNPEHEDPVKGWRRLNVLWE